MRQVAYGISAITIEVAYFTYMYANIERKDCKVVTSYTHSAIHFGQFLSGVVGQILVSFKVLGLDQINYLSLGGAVASFMIALFIPKVFRDYVSTALETLEKKKPLVEDKEKAESIQKPQNREIASDVKETDETKPKENKLNPEKNHKGIDYRRYILGEKSKFHKWKECPKLAKENLIYAYGNWRIIKWSVWWVMAYGLYIQVDLYIESLWKEIEHHSHQKVFNGAVHASHAIISKKVRNMLGILLFFFKLRCCSWIGNWKGSTVLENLGCLYFWDFNYYPRICIVLDG